MFRVLGKSKIAFVLAILFGISLFFFKSGSRYSNFFNSDSVIANVSSTSISTTKFNRTMQMNIDKFNQMLGKQMTGDEIRSFQVHSLALGALINEAVFEDEYDKINFIIDDKVVAQKTKERIPNLYDSNNKLDEMYLNTFLQQQQLKIEDIVQIIDFETRDKYFNEAFFAVNYPKFFSDKINIYEKQKRQISYIEIPLNNIQTDYLNSENSSNLDEDLDRFYNDNINQYMSKEKRNVEYVLLNKNEIGKFFNPTDFEIEEYYNQNKELFYQNEKRSFFQFNFKNIEEAKKFKQQIINLNLENILAFSKSNNIRFNEFENLEANEILEQISVPLFRLKQDEQSEIIETSLAKHVIVLKSIKPANQLKLKDVNEEIKLTIKNIETKNLFNDLLDKISVEILNGNSLTNIAQKFNLKVQTIDDLTKDKNDYDKSQEIVFNSLIQTSFKSNKDFVSNLININNNLSYFFNVTNIDLSSPIEFAKIRNKVINDLNDSNKIEMMQTDIENNISNQNYISDLVNKYQISLKDITISNNSKEIPNNLLSNIFSAEKNQNVQKFYNDSFYIARINEIILPENNADAKSISIQNDLRSSFGQELIKNKKIKINENLVSALIEQY